MKLYNEWKPDIVTVSGDFIDYYMPQASGEFVKVYLSLLRTMEKGGGELTISGLADTLNHTEKDVIRALKYWERMQLLRLGYEGEELKDVVLTALPGQNRMEEGEQPTVMDGRRQTAIPEGKSSSAVLEGKGPSMVLEGKYPSVLRGTGTPSESVQQRPQTAVYETVPLASVKEVVREQPEKDPSSLKRLEGDEEFKQLLFVAGQYIGAPLTRKDCDTFAYLYDQLKQPAELLEYLIEYCVSMGHKSVRYMEAVALDLHKKEVVTVEQAKAALPTMKKDHYAVMKAFGLNSRQPSPGEKQMMDKWFSSYGLSREMVLEACSLTMSAIHKPSFEYTDKILEAWKENGAGVLADVKALDEKRSREKGKKSGKAAEKKTTVRSNQFHNFEQREYDFDELMRRING